MTHANVKNPARPLERKDDGDVKNKNLDTKDALKGFMGAFEEFKTTNDERLKAVEGNKGVAELEGKLDKINKSLDQFEGINQRLTTAEKLKDEIKSVDDRFDVIETMLKRAGHENGGGDLDSKARTIEWAKSMSNAITNGRGALSDADVKCLDAVAAEFKALNVGTDSAGGYLAPIEYSREIIKGITEMTGTQLTVILIQPLFAFSTIPRKTGI
ncbi:MAG: phage major capsid protein [Rhodobacteraceae bacterium]|nr:phage major capsid protein [Paracoccaceae bacterium]